MRKSRVRVLRKMALYWAGKPSESSLLVLNTGATKYSGFQRLYKDLKKEWQHMRGSKQWRTFCPVCRQAVLIRKKKKDILPHPPVGGVGRCPGSGRKMGVAK